MEIFFQSSYVAIGSVLIAARLINKEDPGKTIRALVVVLVLLLVVGMFFEPYLPRPIYIANSTAFVLIAAALGIADKYYAPVSSSILAGMASVVFVDSTVAPLQWEQARNLSIIVMASCYLPLIAGRSDRRAI